MCWFRLEVTPLCRIINNQGLLLAKYVARSTLAYGAVSVYNLKHRLYFGGEPNAQTIETQLGNFRKESQI